MSDEHEQDLGIAAGMSEADQRMYRRMLAQCELEYHVWLGNQVPEQADARKLDSIEFLKIRIEQQMTALENLRRFYARFNRSMKTSAREEDQKQVILTFAKELGATPAELKQDAKAFARWFGADAVKDRYHRRHAQYEQYAAFLLDRVAAVAVSHVRNLKRTEDQIAFWKVLELENTVKPLLVHDGDVRLELAAFRCFAAVLSALSPEIQDLAVDDTTLQYIYRSALQHQQDVWIQCSALELLVTLSWASFEHALRHRLQHPATGDDLFVRRRAVQLLACHFPRLDCGHALIPTLLSDPSAFVRQALPKVLIQASPTVAILSFEHLILKDKSPQVRAMAWLEWPGLLADQQFRPQALQLFREVAPQEKDDFVLRVICLVAERSTRLLRRSDDAFLAEWCAAAREVLLTLRCGAAGAKVRRWASQSFEFIWSECHPDARALRDDFADFARSIPRGHSRLLPAGLTEGFDPAFIGRVWSIVCRNDYDAQLQSTRRGYKVTRAHVFGFRWWRWWHEFRHASPDKRQAFPHTIGRLFDGELHIPSAIMSELAQTKVPGEPLHISAEGGWRPYLPLPDELTSSVELGRWAKPFRIFTAEGITTIVPPRGRKRLRALKELTWHFRHYAEKRNWLDSMQEPANTYICALVDLGFEIHFDTYPDEKGRPLPADPMVLRFFPRAPIEVAGEPAGKAAQTRTFTPAVPEPVAHRLRPQTDSAS